MEVAQLQFGAPDCGLLTVCVDEETKAALAQSAPYFVQGQSTGDLSEYAQADRNTRLLQRALHGRVVIVVDFDRDREQALVATDSLYQMFRSHAAIVGIGSNMDAGSVLGAMRAGCVDFFSKPLDLEQVVGALQRLKVRWSPEEHFQQNRGQVLALIGTKGGVGTTTLAVHLGTFLARSKGKKTLLIDHHQQLGHVCLYLGMDANYYSFQEMVKNVDRLDLSLLNSFVAHHASGLDVLASPDTFNLTTATQAEAEVQTLEFLRTQYDFVLLDCSFGLTDVNLALMENSDEFYLVSTPDVAALRDLSRHVDRLLQTSNFEGRMQVAINRYSSESAVSLEQIQTAVRLPIAVTVPNDYFKLLQAINEGKPISPEKNTEFVRQFRKWTDRVCAAQAPGAAPQTKTRRFFGLWK